MYVYLSDKSNNVYGRYNCSNYKKKIISFDKFYNNAIFFSDKQCIKWERIKSEKKFFLSTRV